MICFRKCPNIRNYSTCVFIQLTVITISGNKYFLSKQWCDHGLRRTIKLNDFSASEKIKHESNKKYSFNSFEKSKIKIAVKKVCFWFDCCCAFISEGLDFVEKSAKENNQMYSMNT